jgi:hypothetical protein
MAGRHSLVNVWETLSIYQYFSTSCSLIHHNGVSTLGPSAVLVGRHTLRPSLPSFAQHAPSPSRPGPRVSAATAPPINHLPPRQMNNQTAAALARCIYSYSPIVAVIKPPDCRCYESLRLLVMISCVGSPLQRRQLNSPIVN